MQLFMCLQQESIPYLVFIINVLCNALFMHRCAMLKKKKVTKIKMTNMKKKQKKKKNEDEENK